MKWELSKVSKTLATTEVRAIGRWLERSPFLGTGWTSFALCDRWRSTDCSRFHSVCSSDFGVAGGGFLTASGPSALVWPIAAVAAVVHGSNFSLLSRGSLWPIAVPRSLSPFSWPLAVMEAVAVLLCQLVVWGVRLASQAWDAGGCGDVCCPPAFRCLWSVAAVSPLYVGSAASSFPPVVPWSGHSIG